MYKRQVVHNTAIIIKVNFTLQNAVVDVHYLVSVRSESHTNPFCNMFVFQQVTIIHNNFWQTVLEALLHFQVRPSIVVCSLSSRESVLVKHMQFQVLLVSALTVVLRTAVVWSGHLQIAITVKVKVQREIILY